MIKKIKYILAIFIALFTFNLAVNKVSAGVICEYGEFEIELSTPTKTTFDWKISKGGVDLDTNEINWYPKYDDSTAIKMVKDNDVSVCLSKVYIYKSTYKGESDYSVFGSRYNGLTADEWDMDEDDEEFIVDLTDSYCYNCEHADPVEPGYNNYEDGETKACGKVTGIPSFLPRMVSIVYILIQIAIPVVLVIIGILDLLKAITADKAEDIAKSQKLFFNRLIYAVLVFFIFAIVKVVITAFAKGSNNIVLCMECFIRNDCREAIEGRWECVLDNYQFDVDGEGKIYLKYQNVPITSITSDFVPTKKGACPADTEYRVNLKTANNNSYSFDIEKK